MGFVAALAQESARAGITVNALLPFAHTPMTDGLFKTEMFRPGTDEVMTPAAVTNLMLWLLSEQCLETGQTWLAGGRVFRKALPQVTRGIVVDGDASPECLAAQAAAIAAPADAATYGSGAELLSAMTKASLGPSRDKRGIATFVNPRTAEYKRPGGPWAELTLCRLLQEAPDRDDLICGEHTRLSTAELRTSVRHMAGWLHDRGVGPGDAVAWQVGNDADAVVLYLATWWAGALAVPFHDTHDRSRGTEGH